MYVCMSHRVPPLTYRRTPSSHKDRKGSFTIRPTGKVPGYKKYDKNGLLYTITSMLAHYQQGCHIQLINQKEGKVCELHHLRN